MQKIFGKNGGGGGQLVVFPSPNLILEEIYLSGRQILEQAEVPVRTIENWATAGNIQQNEKGQYGLISVYKHQLKSLSARLEKANEEKTELIKRLNEDYADARERKAIAEADKEVALAAIKQLELQKLQGKLVDSVEVEEAWANLIANCCAKFSGLPTKLALELSGMKPEEIQARLSEAIDEALLELSVTR